MNINELLASQHRWAALITALRDGTKLPDSTAVGANAHPAVRQLMLHFNRNDEMDCRLLNPDEIEFMGDMFHAVLDDPEYQPKPSELVAIRAINFKLGLCGCSN